MINTTGIPSPYVLPGTKIDPFRVRKVVAAHYEISPTDLFLPTRKACIATPRMLAMAIEALLNRKKYQFSRLEAIGQIYNKDHATVLHALRTVSTRLQNDAAFRYDALHVLKALNIAETELIIN